MPDHEVVRRTQGEMNCETALELRPNYGARAPVIELAGKLGYRIHYGWGMAWLRTTVPMEISDGSLRDALESKRESLCFFR